MSRNRAIVEIDPATQLPIRIFRIPTLSLALPPERVREWPKTEAITAIRRQVFERDEHECRHCGRRVTWDNAEMNEIQFKGNGGEVSLENCELLCHACHQGRADSVHGNRRWQSAKQDVR